MKIKFDAETLRSVTDHIKTALPPATKNMPVEELLALRSEPSTTTSGPLIIYGYAKGQWAKATTTCEVEEAGTIVLNRAKFFALLEKLSGTVTLRKIPGAGRVEISTSTRKGKFTMSLSTSITPKPSIEVDAANTSVHQLSSKKLFDHLKLCILDGDILGGGYRLSRKNGFLEILVSDGLRLITTKERDEGVDFDFTVIPEAIKGVFELLRTAEGRDVFLKYNNNVGALVLTEEGLEFGFHRPVTKFPDVDKIINVSGYTSQGRFEVEDLLDVVDKATVLSEDMTQADFHFDTETCRIVTDSREGSAELHIDCPAEIEEKGVPVIRLRLDLVKSFLKKLVLAKSDWVNVQWGERLPVRWTPDPDEPQAISFKLIQAQLNRAAAAGGNK